MLLYIPKWSLCLNYSVVLQIVPLGGTLLCGRILSKTISKCFHPESAGVFYSLEQSCINHQKVNVFPILQHRKQFIIHSFSTASSLINGSISSKKSTLFGNNILT